MSLSLWLLLAIVVVAVMIPRISNPKVYPLPPESDGTDYIVKLKRYTVAFDPASINAALVSAQDVTVTGVAVGDTVLNVEPQAAFSVGIGIAGWRVKSANTVTIFFINPTAGALDASSVNLLFTVATLKTPTGG